MSALLYQDDNEQNVVLSKNDLVEIIRTVVRGELDNYKHTCRFAITEKEAEQVSHYMSMMTDLGDGELDKGVRLIQKNHEWLKETREKSNKIVNVFLLTITGAVASALIYTLWEGIKRKLG